ncbi:disease resistance protein RPS2-like [Camellia sinensis]|uniref:disease resistance protein RPS2-like n=1 Tax=Camellia sinensis TaxID=4442 RepID=UPI00103670E4|nr:disease resistance protein RPS2-like [Camellia sinensis]
MCTPHAILSSITRKITNVVIESVVRHVSFLLFYKKNLKALDTEMKILQNHRGKNKGKVDEALTRGEDVNDDVSNWLNQVDGVTQAVEEFMDEKTTKENMQCKCFKLSCPNFIWRYRLSKQAQKKIHDAKKLREDGSFERVARAKPPPSELQFPSSSDYVSLDSRALVLKRIMDALKHSTVNIVGIYGTGGVGKTTMVEEVGKQMKEHRVFDEVVMVAVSQDANVFKIQGRLADRLNLKLDMETEVGRAAQLWNRLNNGKKNLLILDDIWKELNFKEIGIPITDGNKGCKVVLTSRIRSVWKHMKVDRDFSIQVLSDVEALALFRKVVGNSIDSPHLHLLAKRVCKECQGLPVVILAVGAALKNKEKYAWEDALDQLRNSMLKNVEGIDPKMYASLKLSYDCLESKDAKSCFLLCCLFPEDNEISIDDLVKHCVARRLLDQNPDTLEKARYRVLTVVETLKTSCLLLDATDENVVKMHDVIRDVAISIAKEQEAFLVKHGVQEWLEKGTYESYSAISLVSETIHDVPNELGCPQLHTLLLEYNNSLLKVADMFFSGMDRLAVLDVSGISMAPLTSSLANLVNLRMLRLNKCKLEDIAILKELKNTLEILSLRGSDIMMLPPEVGQLIRLRLLDLGNCDQLTVIPQGIISNLSCLEELYISDSFDQWEATTVNKEISNVSLVELKSLTRLTTLHIHIPNVMLLPKDLRFENLIRFKISVGGRFGKNENYSSTRILKLEGISLPDELMVLFDKVEVLYLKKIQGLKKVAHDRFLNLKFLEVINCDDLEHLLGKPKWFMESHELNPPGPFNKLIVLKVRDCNSKHLFSPSFTRALLQLQRLEIQNCEIMEEIVGIEGEKDEGEIASKVNFSQLKYMELRNLGNLISFYPEMKKTRTSEGNSSVHAESLFNEKVGFPALEALDIVQLPKIIKIWNNQLLQVPEIEASSFCQLTVMKVWCCEKLVNVVPSNMLRPLQNLKELNVDSCGTMEVIVSKNPEGTEDANDHIFIFPRLRTLHLSDCENLISFYSSSTKSQGQPFFNHQVALPTLEVLEIERMPNITEIWDKKLVPDARSFCELSRLMLWHCDKLVNAFPSNMLPQLQNLKLVSLNYCYEMEAIVSQKEEEEVEANGAIMVFTQLRTLKLESMKNLKTFYTSSSDAQPFFNHQIAFPELKELSFRRVPKITQIWDKQLLPKKAESFCQLTIVKVWFCDKLVNLVPYSMLQQLQNLEELDIAGCPKMEVIVSKKAEKEETAKNNVIVFSQLNKLKLGNMENLRSFYSCSSLSDAQPLFNHQVAFPALVWLDIHMVANITEIWGNKLFPAKSFDQLKEVTVWSCYKLMNLASSNVLSQLKNLQKLTIEHCRKMEMLVSMNGEEEQEQVLFPQLWNLKLKGLPSLKSFASSKFETKPFFDFEIAFPELKDKFLDDDLKQLLLKAKESNDEANMTNLDSLNCMVVADDHHYFI